MGVAGAGMALFPYAAMVNDNLKLGPFLVTVCLAALLMAQRAGSRPSTGRLVAVGVLIGLAGTIKIWAFFPFLALLAGELVRSRRRAGWLVAGAAGGFGVPCLPFLLLAPGRMVHEVVLDQLGRGAYDYPAVSLPSRLGYLTGVDAVVGHPNGLGAALGVVLTAGALGAIGAALVAWRRGRGVWGYPDTLVAASAVASVGGLLAAPGMYPAYTDFTAPFAAGLVGILLAEHRRRRGSRPAHLPGLPVGSPRRLARLVGAGLAVGLVGWLALTSVSTRGDVLGGGRLAANGTVVGEGQAIARVIPAGTCVVSDDPSFLLEAGRFRAARPGCPELLDPFGVWLVADHGRGAVGRPPLPPTVVATWHAAFARAGALVLSNLNRVEIPWTPALEAQVAREFKVVVTEPGATVYLRRTPS